MIKLFIMLVLCIISLQPGRPVACMRQINLYHIGMLSDKPIETLIFATTKVRVTSDNRYPDIVILSDEEFTRVEHLLKTFNSSPFTDLRNAPYGAFGVTVVDSCKKIRENRYSPARSRALLQFMLKNNAVFSPKNQELVKRVITIRLHMIEM